MKCKIEGFLRHSLQTLSLEKIGSKIDTRLTPRLSDSQKEFQCVSLCLDPHRETSRKKNS